MMIKPLETADEIDGKALVHYRAWKEAYAGLLDPAFLAGRTPELSRERALRAFQNKVSTLIAKDGPEVVGFADYGRYRWDDLSEAGEIYALYLLKAYYGKGIGRALMDRALAALGDCRQVAVWVLEGNERAIRFYTRCGFAFDGKKLETVLGARTTELRMILRRD